MTRPDHSDDKTGVPGRAGDAGATSTSATSAGPAAPTTPDRAVSRFVLAALAVPAALTTAAVALQVAALPDLPDPIATHWGGAGTANGFSPAWTVPVLTAAVGLGLPALLAAFSLPGLRRGARGPSYRLLGAVAAGLSALMAVLTTGSTLMQRGLADAHDAPAIWAPLIGGFVAGVAVGVTGWLLQPAQRTPASPSSVAVSLPLGETERAAWMSETAIAPAGAALIGAAVLLVGGSAAGAWLFAEEAGVAWMLTAVAALLVLVAATTLVFRVRVDTDGLTVRSVLGMPRFRIPLGQVAEVRVVSVDPIAEFGGWGIRRAPGRSGVVLRSGPGVEVERVDGHRFVVTAPDAATGAALLQTLSQRGRAARG